MSILVFYKPFKMLIKTNDKKTYTVERIKQVVSTAFLVTLFDLLNGLEGRGETEFLKFGGGTAKKGEGENQIFQNWRGRKKGGGN